jgi:thymidylate synthase
MNVEDIRFEFFKLLTEKKFVTDKSGVKMLELTGVSFIADEDSIFGEVNQDYAMKELNWYRTKSRNIYDMPDPPAIWKEVADPDGNINSNYGWCIWSSENCDQYDNVLNELKTNPFSRRATMIYTRPMMWDIYDLNGRSDFMCTNTVGYLIRDDKLQVIVQMRSNDIWAGFRNDYFWQKTVQLALIDNLNDFGFGHKLVEGSITWQVNSLHAYEKDFYLIDHWIRTGKKSITKKKYRELYPYSEWCAKI